MDYVKEGIPRQRKQQIQKCSDFRGTAKEAVWLQCSEQEEGKW